MSRVGAARAPDNEQGTAVTSTWPFAPCRQLTPGLGGFRAFQVPIIDIAALTGLDLGSLPDADVLPRPALSLPPASLRAGAAPPDRWVELHNASVIQLER